MSTRAHRTPRTWRRLAGVAAVVLLAGAGGTARGAVQVDVVRHEGADRYATAAAIATAASGDSVTVYLTRGDDYADGLATSGLAGILGAPLLLTPSDDLADATERALDDLEASRVFIVGGSGAVSQQVRDEIAATGREVLGIAGANRYETAARIFGSCSGADCWQPLGGRRTAILVSGEGYADAIAAGPLAYRQILPVLLTTRDELPTETREAIRTVERVVIIGGTAAVGSAVEDELLSMGITVDRVAGGDRQATAVAVAEFERTVAGWSVDAVLLARGDAFPDALAGSALGGHLQAPILLTSSPTELGDASRAELENLRVTVDTIHVLGDESAVSEQVATEAAQAATLV